MRIFTFVLLMFGLVCCSGSEPEKNDRDGTVDAKEADRQERVEKIRTMTVNDFMTDIGAPPVTELANSKRWLQEMDNSTMFHTRFIKKAAATGYEAAIGILAGMEHLMREVPLTTTMKSDYNSPQFARFVGAVQVLISLGNDNPIDTERAIGDKVQSDLDKANARMEGR